MSFLLNKQVVSLERTAQINAFVVMDVTRFRVPRYQINVNWTVLKKSGL